MTTERETLFGNDLLLVDHSGGFDLIGDWAGDLDLAQGNDNIIQALKLRLLVRRGELTRLGWPSFGSRIHELIGEPDNNRTRVLLMAHARESIEQDPRVAEVREVRAESPPGERGLVMVYLEILLINEQNPVNLVARINLGET